MTVIRGGDATSNKGFIKTKQRHVFCYDLRQFSLYTPIVKFLCIAMLQ